MGKRCSCYGKAMVSMAPEPDTTSVTRHTSEFYDLIGQKEYDG